jgi:hypothetical protein
MSTLNTTHNAIINATTMYRKNTHNAADYKHAVLKRSTNKKLGKKVKKGIWKNKPIYTLTLIERETCLSDCEHWLDCYGNNMPFAHRFQANDALLEKIDSELHALDKRHATGYVVRLHVLGDFYSTRYVMFWQRQIEKHPSMKIYGYSRWHPDTAIGQAIKEVRTRHPDQFKIRFSNLPTDALSASSEHVSTIGITCPVQIDKTDNCGTCGLCWTAQKPIIFLDH